MAFLTVSQLRTLVAAIPTSANTFEVDVPDLLVPVVQGRLAGSGGTLYIVKGYLDFTARTWTPVP